MSDDDVVKRDTRGLTLSEEELYQVTGYRQSAKQLTELHRLGFVRARRSRLGTIVLERTHYEAVCKGQYGLGSGHDGQPQPKLRLLDQAPTQRKGRRTARGDAG